MKKKKLIKYFILILLLLSVYGIYHFFKTDKINYIALGDSVAEGMNPYGEVGYSYTDYLAELLQKDHKLSYYTKKYTKSGYVTEDIIRNLQTNNNLKKDLRESNLVTISIGANDFLHKIDLKSLDVSNIIGLKNKVTEVLPDIEKCIKEVRKYAKDDIIIVGYYNPIPFLFNTSGNDLDELFAYIDDEYNKIANNNNCRYLSMYQLFKKNTNFLPNPADIHPNLDGYQEMANQIYSFYRGK